MSRVHPLSQNGLGLAVSSKDLKRSGFFRVDVLFPYSEVKGVCG